jgi:hypothetical protein
MSQTDYRPTRDDYTNTAKFQQLSCREAGQFDAKANHPQSKWGHTCALRAARKTHRRFKKENAQ